MNVNTLKRPNGKDSKLVSDIRTVLVAKMCDFWRKNTKVFSISDFGSTNVSKRRFTNNKLFIVHFEIFSILTG